MYRHMYQPPDKDGVKPKELKLPTVNITIQWTISSEALNSTNHAFGGTWGGTNDTFHHNLFACNTGRNSSMGLGGDFNYINNVVFNWRHRTVDGGDDTSHVNMINNYFKPGPITNVNAPIGHRIIKADSKRGKNIPLQFGKFYVSGNIVEGNEKITADNWAGGVQIADPTPGVSEDSEPANETVATTAPAKPKGPQRDTSKDEKVEDIKVDQPFPHAPVTINSAKEAFELVLAKGGASLPVRDSVDKRVIEEVRTGKVTFEEGKGILMEAKDAGGYPEYKGEPVKMSLNDGIPDWWKAKYNLDQKDADLAGKDTGDGYTYIEKYLYGLDPTKKVDWKDLKNNVNNLGDGSALRQ